MPRFQGDARQLNQQIVEALASIANRKNVTPAQIALAWLLAQKPWIVPIPGTTKLARLQENTDAVQVSLTDNELQEIARILAKMPVQGQRYTEQSMKLIDQ